ncbi:ABC transporter permease [Bacillus sp. EB600]|uniref:ABC transporter permease n=1 Tax=Bacillus sp. EB600 TaxID=2806345 RepID=UPI00210BBB3E|nr:ABC transporter permease [Bacillus sp. EB600]MCQ6278272.1 hypothetical protein [Bacillus sp. EB600]
MDEFFWAFGSMLFVMLIVYFLPLGFSKKGKIILVFTSFLLALGGLAATASFSFLLTSLILIVLILFGTYLMDQRMGKWLYAIDDFLAKQEDEDFFINSEMESAVSRENVYQSKGKQQLEPINILKVNDEKKSQNEFKKNRESDFLTVETGDEDISFLLNRSISMEKEHSDIIEEPMHEVDYLSEIEGLLVEDSDKSVDQSKTVQNQEVIVEIDEHEIPVISLEDKSSNETSTNPAQQFDDLDEIPIISFHEKEGKQS